MKLYLKEIQLVHATWGSFEMCLEEVAFNPWK
jgi:hypothetical protein